MSLAAVHRKALELEKQMQKAAEAMDFETAARLRNEIAALRGQSVPTEPDGIATPLVRQPPPGEMGLGTHIPVTQRPKGWKPPKKPDPMTKNVSKRKK